MALIGLQGGESLEHCPRKGQRIEHQERLSRGSAVVTETNNLKVKQNRKNYFK